MSTLQLVISSADWVLGANWVLGATSLGVRVEECRRVARQALGLGRLEECRRVRKALVSPLSKVVAETAIQGASQRH